VLIKAETSLENLKEGASCTAALWPSWDHASFEMVKAINQLLQLPENRHQFLSAISKISYDKEIRSRRNYLNKIFALFKKVLPSYFLNLFRTVKISFEVITVSMRPK
jgi:hypothetical protein